MIKWYKDIPDYVRCVFAACSNSVSDVSPCVAYV